MPTASDAISIPPPPPRGFMRVSGGKIGAVILLLIALPCFLTLPWSIKKYNDQMLGEVGVDARRPPSFSEPMGSDQLGRPLHWRCMLGGAISLGIGCSAALISVVIGTGWGAIAGYVGGRLDGVMMRIVDVLYGLPYVLLVVLVDLALTPVIERVLAHFFVDAFAQPAAGVVTLLIAIGGVSWLTLARVVRGQVLSLRGQPFIEAARATGLGPMRIFFRHLLPNLIGPIVVYTTLTVPAAILQESFLSFLGIGVQLPLPSWGNLASDGVGELAGIGLEGATMRWWLLVWPCALLGLTLMALNFLGDALRNKLDPKSR